MYDYASYMSTLNTIREFQSVVSIIGGVVTIFDWWMLFSKAGRPGWYALIPGFNVWVYFDIAHGSGFNMFYLFIPIFGGFYMLYTYYKFAQMFGKSTGFCVGNLFLPVVFSTIMAFDSSEYQGRLSW